MQTASDVECSWIDTSTPRNGFAPAVRVTWFDRHGQPCRHGQWASPSANRPVRIAPSGRAPGPETPPVPPVPLGLAAGEAIEGVQAAHVGLPPEAPVGPGGAIARTEVVDMEGGAFSFGRTEPPFWGCLGSGAVVDLVVAWGLNLFGK